MEQVIMLALRLQQNDEPYRDECVPYVARLCVNTRSMVRGCVECFLGSLFFFLRPEVDFLTAYGDRASEVCASLSSAVQY